MKQKCDWMWLQYKSHHFTQSCIIIPIEIEAIFVKIYKFWICQVSKLQNFNDEADVELNKKKKLQHADPGLLSSLSIINCYYY